MKARDALTARVTAATPKALARDLILQMLSGTYSGLPVVNSKREVIGDVTKFDLLFAVQSERTYRQQGKAIHQQTFCARRRGFDAVIAKMTGNGIVAFRGTGRWGTRRCD